MPGGGNRAVCREALPDERSTRVPAPLMFGFSDILLTPDFHFHLNMSSYSEPS